MHSNLIEKIISRRLRALAETSSDAPYDWTEFQRRRRTLPRATALVGRERSLAVAASVVAALLVTGIAIVRSSHQHAPAPALSDTAARVNVSSGADTATTPDRLTFQHTRELEGWLADLPRDRSVVRVGAHAAETSLQDQLAALDDLIDAEQVAGAQPSRLDALEHQRAQLVSSLAQLRYAEMLASATP